VEQRQRSVFKLCCLVVILIVAICVNLEAIEVRTGLLVHDVANLWGYTKQESGVDINSEFIFGGSSLLRSNVGVSINSRGGTSLVYGGVLLGFRVERLWFDFAFGGAAHVNAIRNLGSTLLFRLAFEVGHMWGKHGVSVLFSHASNGAGFFDWKIPNAGIDKIGVRYVYRF